MHEPERSEIRRLLARAISDAGIDLPAPRMAQFECHFAQLLKWNKRINLTSVRAPAEIAARHFAESLYLTRLIAPPDGPLVDIGSGAGFPGLPLNAAWPSEKTVLLEANHKKATFLKEVIRGCGFAAVEVHAERLDEALAHLAGTAALATMRAVAPDARMLREIRQLLRPGGRVALYLGEQAAGEMVEHSGFSWDPPAPIPYSERRVILLGQRTEDTG